MPFPLYAGRYRSTHFQISDVGPLLPLYSKLLVRQPCPFQALLQIGQLLLRHVDLKALRCPGHFTLSALATGVNNQELSGSSRPNTNLLIAVPIALSQQVASTEFSEKKPCGVDESDGKDNFNCTSCRFKQ